MPKRRWSDLSARTRAAIVILGAADLALRAWSIADLSRRPQAQVNGPKLLWMTTLSVVSSMGLLPAVYLSWGRRAGAAGSRRKRRTP